MSALTATEAGNDAVQAFLLTLDTYPANDQFYVGFVGGQLLAIEIFMEPDPDVVREARQAVERWQRAGK